jgi:hypothetical protein
MTCRPRLRASIAVVGLIGACLIATLYALLVTGRGKREGFPADVPVGF